MNKCKKYKLNNPPNKFKIRIIKESEALKASINHNPLFMKNVILSNNEVPNFLQLATVEFISGAVIDMHSHESVTEIYYLISDSLKLLTNGDTFLIEKEVDKVRKSQKLGLVERMQKHFGNDLLENYWRTLGKRGGI